jgi:hypothetical protein
MTPPNPPNDLSLTSADIYLAAEEGVLPHADAERLVHWGFERRFNESRLPDPKAPIVEQRKGLNLLLRRC